MSYEYSVPKLASDTYSLPNIEVFSAPSWSVTCNRCGRDDDENHNPCCIECGREATIINPDTCDGPDKLARVDVWATRTGKVKFWYWHCFPGCLPDSDASGPFDTYDAALADAREQDADESEEI